MTLLTCIMRKGERRELNVPFYFFHEALAFRLKISYYNDKIMFLNERRIKMSKEEALKELEEIRKEIRRIIEELESLT